EAEQKLAAVRAMVRDEIAPLNAEYHAPWRARRPAFALPLASFQAAYQASHGILPDPDLAQPFAHSNAQRASTFVTLCRELVLRKPCSAPIPATNSA
ncbi:MAG: hypothetical protein AAFN80_03620, partial [Pseudomonadota bacterium]